MCLLINISTPEADVSCGFRRGHSPCWRWSLETLSQEVLRCSAPENPKFAEETQNEMPLCRQRDAAPLPTNRSSDEFYMRKIIWSSIN